MSVIKLTMYVILAVPALVAFVAVMLAIAVSVRSGRGYGLSIVSFLLLACTILALLLFSSSQRPTTLGGAMIFAAFRSIVFHVEVFVTLCILIVTAIVAGIGGQRLWLVGLLVEALILALALVLPPFPSLGAIATVRREIMDATFSPVPITLLLALLLIPQATALAYNGTRLILPIMRARRPRATP